MKKRKPEAKPPAISRKKLKKADPELDFPERDTLPPTPEPQNDPSPDSDRVDAPQSEIKNQSEINNNSAFDIPNSEIKNIPQSEIKGHSAFDIPQSEIKISEIEHPKSEIQHHSAFDIPQSALKNVLRIPEIQTTPDIPMEVHHHPQVEKKGLKEYLLEGLMIFIAVMMGFFAESLRERITENSRASEYAVTLSSDLKADTAELNEYVAYFKPGTANVDTLIKLLSAADPKQIPTGRLYWFGLFGGLHLLCTPNDATLLEMKSSGSL